jgi:hypothetical protein
MTVDNLTKEEFFLLMPAVDTVGGQDLTIDQLAGELSLRIALIKREELLQMIDAALHGAVCLHNKEPKRFQDFSFLIDKMCFDVLEDKDDAQEMSYYLDALAIEILRKKIKDRETHDFTPQNIASIILDQILVLKKIKK